MEYAVIPFTGITVVVLIAFGKMIFIGRGKTERDALRDVEKQTRTNSANWKKIN